MPLARTEITASANDDPPRDALTNIVYHTIDDGTFDPAVDWDNHCQQVLDCFTGNAAGYAGANQYVSMKVVAKTYDMANAEPRPVKAHKSYIPGPGPNGRSEFGPSQVALCLSYYGARNLPSERGRIYLGGFAKTDIGHPRPTDAQLAVAVTTGHALFDVGGENVAWVVRSNKHGTVEPITTIWSDDAWDTQRRRELRSTKRVTLAP